MGFGHYWSKGHSAEGTWLLHPSPAVARELSGKYSTDYTFVKAYLFARRKLIHHMFPHLNSIKSNLKSRLNVGIGQKPGSETMNDKTNRKKNGKPNNGDMRSRYIDIITDKDYTTSFL